MHWYRVSYSVLKSSMGMLVVSQSVAFYENARHLLGDKGAAELAVGLLCFGGVCIFCCGSCDMKI